MNLMFSRSIEGYLHDPSRNDGLTILHIDPKDADKLEEILLPYGFELHRASIHDDLVVKNGEIHNSSQAGLWDIADQSEDSLKDSSNTSKLKRKSKKKN